MLRLYSIFHLNLAYSSIPEAHRKEVIDRCFWPLIRLATEDRIPIAIEAPAYTLEVAFALDPAWGTALNEAIMKKCVEFIGAGYVQLIAPLVPAQVNEWNLSIGKEIYKKLLDHVPDIWYINEQAYSAGIVENYNKVGAIAIVMEWNNPRTLHPEWNEEFRYYPQCALGTNGNSIPVIWNDSITFQKFQRYAHNDIDWEDFCSYLMKHQRSEERNFCLYGNDVEIFDLRPGRFATEPILQHQSEWEKIRGLYSRLKNKSGISLIFPSEVLKTLGDRQQCSSLSLESAVQPIPVKKQPKYNVTRWAVTGRNSLYINTTCHKILRRLFLLQSAFSEETLHSLGKKICYLWSSDFRTHITSERWESFLREIRNTERELDVQSGSAEPSNPSMRHISVNGLRGNIYTNIKLAANLVGVSGKKKHIEEGDRFLSISTQSVHVLLNKKRGLAFHSVIFPIVFPKALIGTIPHGYFNDISLSADWYSANTVLQCTGRPQIVDLQQCYATIENGNGIRGEWVKCSGEVMTEAGPIRKQFTVYEDIPQIDCEITFDWHVIPYGAFKAAILTIIPESFEEEELFYATHNGGKEWEVFKMAGSDISHDRPASSIVTASHGLGATEGFVIIGDSKKGIGIYYDKAVCAAMPMIAYKKALPSFFCRLMFSCGEMDESRGQEIPGPLRFVCNIFGMKRS